MKRILLIFLTILCSCQVKTLRIQKKEINLFINRKEALFSPDGFIDTSKIAISPDEKYYAKILEPYERGEIGIFFKENDNIRLIIKTLKEDEKNYLKTIVWHPNNLVLCTILHKDNYSIITFYEIITGSILRKIYIGGFYHYAVFDNSGKILYLSEDSSEITELCLRNSNFVQNSGINLPWINYGWDIGRNPWNEKEHGGFSTNKELIRKKFKNFKDKNFNIVRVFLFCDLRSGIIFDKEWNSKFDKYVYDDFNALIEVAKENDLKLMPVILDYTIKDDIIEENGSKVGEYPEIFYNKKVRRNFFKLFEEFFRNIDTKDVIFAWDIINEPEHLKVEKDSIDEFLNSFIQIIRKYRQKEKITIGFSQGQSLYKNKDLNLDLFQFHFYNSYKDIFSPVIYHKSNYLIGKPIIIGEMNPENLIEKLTQIYEKNYDGILLWESNIIDEEIMNLYKAWTDVY